MRSRLGRAALAAAMLVALVSGCGGSGNDDDASSEAEAIVEQLKSLKEGEILIQGTSPRVYGPYSLAPGGYVLRFEQGAPGDPGRLVVALESKPDSQAAPYQQLVDSKDRSGTRRVTKSGKFYVHVVTAESPYELRLAPRTP